MSTSHATSEVFSSISFTASSSCTGGVTGAGGIPTTGDSSGSGGADGSGVEVEAISVFAGSGVDITISGKLPDVPKVGVRTTGGRTTEDAGTTTVCAGVEGIWLITDPRWQFKESVDSTPSCCLRKYSSAISAHNILPETRSFSSTSLAERLGRAYSMSVYL